MVEFALVAPMFFILLFAIIEGARFVFYGEMLNNATREGARYAIVHGGHTLAPGGCPSGPPAPNTPTCDLDGDNVKEAVRAAALSLIDTGDVSIPDPIWTPPNSALPEPGTGNTGTNDRENYVTVFVDFTYSPLLPGIPSITISARSSLVINN